jgi:putative acetyltransferase
VVCEELLIRRETAADIAAIRTVNEAAFGQRFEADLVDALRRAATPFLSLVAERGREIVGHICFSPVTIGDDAHGQSRGYLGLGPLAVLPAAQNSGIGSRLVLAGLDECRRQRHALVVVVGHPRYYPRFGFQPASRLGLTCEYEVPDDVFMALRFDSTIHVAGLVRYHPAFAGS